MSHSFGWSPREGGAELGHELCDRYGVAQRMTVVGHDPHVEVDVAHEDRHRPRAVRIGRVAEPGQVRPCPRRYVGEVTARGPSAHALAPAQLIAGDIGEHDVRPVRSAREPETVLAL